jgi:hypothetical protein
MPNGDQGIVIDSRSIVIEEIGLTENRKGMTTTATRMPESLEVFLGVNRNGPTENRILIPVLRRHGS